jgi:hypothetical protein
MADLSVAETLCVDRSSYEAHFNSPHFGVGLAAQIVDSLGYELPLTRKFEGSNLVFTLGEHYFLKLTPSFFGDTNGAEILATQAIGNQLSYSIPKIVKLGSIKDWNYIITEAVHGQQAKDVFRSFSESDKITFAEEIGKVIGSIHKLKTPNFERSFGPWEKYLSDRIENCQNIHQEKGTPSEWVDKICAFITSQEKSLRDLKGIGLIHADLNHEHLVLKKNENKWEISGILDFADAMNAPVELEFILPILCFFKGKTERQKRMWDSAKLRPQFTSQNYSNMMMAIALQNRFIAFHDWFGREINNGAVTVEEIASSVFPPI